MLLGGSAGGDGTLRGEAAEDLRLTGPRRGVGASGVSKASPEARVCLSARGDAGSEGEGRALEGDAANDSRFNKPRREVIFSE